MENQEIFDNEVRQLLVRLLEGNFVDKICHLSSKGEVLYTRHLLLQERYELYQKFFDKIAEYVLAKYWYKPIRAYIPSIHPQMGDENIDTESLKCRIAVQNQIKALREVNTDSALNSILDELWAELASSEFKLGF